MILLKIKRKNLAVWQIDCRRHTGTVRLDKLIAVIQMRGDGDLHQRVAVEMWKVAIFWTSLKG